MSVLAAFLRHDFLTNSSYRIKAVLSLFGIVTLLVPMLFVAQALQPTVANAIAPHGDQYFAFLLLGTIALRWTITAVTALPEALGAAVRTGTAEMLFATPVSPLTLVSGMMGYRMIWTLVETVVLLLVGVLLGAAVPLENLVYAVPVLALITLTYAAFGVLGAALIIAFRTVGPLFQTVLVGSSMLGGVYFPTEVIPSWVQQLSIVVPLTYGLRALRHAVLEGSPVQGVAFDLTVLATMAVVLVTASLLALHRAVRYARQAGTLGQY
jgi:ABC-2 type transport system permease protein